MMHVEHDCMINNPKVTTSLVHFWVPITFWQGYLNKPEASFCWTEELVCQQRLPSNVGRTIMQKQHFLALTTLLIHQDMHTLHSTNIPIIQLMAVMTWQYKIIKAVVHVKRERISTKRMGGGGGRDVALSRRFAQDFLGYCFFGSLFVFLSFSPLIPFRHSQLNPTCKLDEHLSFWSLISMNQYHPYPSPTASSTSSSSSSFGPIPPPPNFRYTTER